MKRTLKGADGFTLIELMVVVAIIGILSSIAVPNFKKYQAKAKQSEAKIQLAAVYSTEVKANADYDTYATCLGDLGYETPPKGYYIVGFSAANATQNTIVTTRGGTCGSDPAILPTVYLKVDATGNVAAANLNDAGAATAVSSTTFTAGAAGDISGSGAQFDIWKITQAKALTNAAVGY